MRKLLLLSLCCLGISLSFTSVYAFEEDTHSERVSLSFSPCTGWRNVNIPNSGSGYVCRSYGATMYVPSYSDYTNTVQALLQRIEALEQKIVKLEETQK